MREIVSILGYPESWADELERGRFANGNVWRRRHDTPSWPG
jgi:hypothetical protein